MRSTITEALISMRGLHHADAGRLHGVNLRYHDLPLAQLTQLAQHSDRAVTGLAALITARSDGTITPDTPEYLVLSSGVPVAWLTVHAAVTTPDLPLTPAQARHQSQAAEALGGLYRHTLADLADRREQRAGGEPEEGEPCRALRIAPAADPTRTASIRIGSDLAAAAKAAADAVHPATGPILILAACGYGHYGNHAHRHELGILCAMHTIADEHQVPLSCIGDWIDDDQYIAPPRPLAASPNGSGMPTPGISPRGRHTPSTAWTPWAGPQSCGNTAWVTTSAGTDTPTTCSPRK